MDESQKYDKMVQLYHEVNDYFLHRYLKLSHNHMDEKIAVLEARKAGNCLLKFQDGMKSRKWTKSAFNG